MFQICRLIFSIQYDLDSGRKVFLEDVFENESRLIPGGQWQAANVTWTDVVSNVIVNRLLLSQNGANCLFIARYLTNKMKVRTK